MQEQLSSFIKLCNSINKQQPMPEYLQQINRECIKEGKTYSIDKILLGQYIKVNDIAQSMSPQEAYKELKKIKQQEQKLNSIYTSNNKQNINLFMKDEKIYYQEIKQQYKCKYNQSQGYYLNQIQQIINNILKSQYLDINNINQQSIKSSLQQFIQSLHIKPQLFNHKYCIQSQLFDTFFIFWIHQQINNGMEFKYTRLPHIIHNQNSKCQLEHLQQFTKQPNHNTQISQIHINSKLFSKPQKYKSYTQGTNSNKLSFNIHQLFVFGCKRRYPKPIGMTFDKINEQSQTMSLQKFINLCKFFGLTSIAKRQQLIKIFKQNALNYRTLNQQRFKTIIQKLIQQYSEIGPILSRKNAIEKTNRLKQAEKNNRTNSISKYQFTIRPNIGKYSSVLRQDLTILKNKKLKEKLKKHKAQLRNQDKNQIKKINEKNKVILTSKYFTNNRNMVIKSDTITKSKRLYSKLQRYDNLFPQIQSTVSRKQVQPISPPTEPDPIWDIYQQSIIHSKKQEYRIKSRQNQRKIGSILWRQSKSLLYNH